MREDFISSKKPIFLILGLYLLALSPLVFSTSQLFPFVISKTFFLRLVITLISVSSAILFFIRKSFKEEFTQRLVTVTKNPIFIAIFLYFIIFIISAFLAVDNFNALFGTIDRGEGVVGMIFFFGFLFFTTILFQKWEWLGFFRVSLIVSAIIFIHLLTQVFQGVYHPSSFLGNTIYLGVYFLCTIFFAGIVFILSNREKWNFWRVFSISIFFASFIGIIISNSRGVFVGSAVGIGALFLYFFVNRNYWKKLLPILLLVLVIGTFFFFTKNNPLWSRIPVFDRLATISYEDVSTKTRLYNYRTAVTSVNPFTNGYKKFIFGWGPENFRIISETYYSPEEYFISVEASADRVHSQPLDVLVASGFLGFISYLSIWFFVFYSIFRLRIEGLDGDKKFFKPLILFSMVSYFIQDLFVFDGIVTYIPLFAMLGFLIFLENEQRKQA